MKLPLLLACFVLLAHNVLADQAFFYVSADDGIHRGSLDTATGKLGPLTLASPAPRPNFLAVSPDHKVIYATQRNDVGSYTVGADGALTPLNSVDCGGSGPCHISLDGTGRYIFSANYNDATVACFRLKPDGSVGEQTALQRLTGSGPDQSRQEAAHAHSVYADPANKFVYSCDLGSDHVWSFKFDAAQGSLTPTDPPFATVPPGSGPRHLVFHPNGRFVYVSNEMGHSVTAFTRNAASGALTPFQTLSTLAPGASYPGITITTAEIVCDATGKRLYVSNRGCETLSLFSIAADGKLALAQTTPCVAKFPRFFTLDPTGRWLLSAGQRDGHIAVLKLDPATGQMTATDQVVTTIDPTCILFVPPAK